MSKACWDLLLTVSVVDNSTNDKGRLSKEDIERMVNEAEQYKAEDEAAAARITAKNGLESFAYGLRNSVEGDLKDKIEASDKEALDKAITETISWLDAVSTRTTSPAPVAEHQAHLRSSATVR